MYAAHSGSVVSLDLWDRHRSRWLTGVRAGQLRKGVRDQGKERRHISETFNDVHVLFKAESPSLCVLL
ncbi:hypothetical protein MHYP_G00291170 [Metynnis hypsauchen]